MVEVSRIMIGQKFSMGGVLYTRIDPCGLKHILNNSLVVYVIDQKFRLFEIASWQTCDAIYDCDF